MAELGAAQPPKAQEPELLTEKIDNGYSSPSNLFPSPCALRLSNTFPY